MIWVSICDKCKKFDVLHGKQVECDCKVKREKNESFYVPKTEEIFNRGLGCRTYSTRDAERKAKQLSKRLSEREGAKITLTCAGNERIEAPFIQKKKINVREIIERQRRRFAS